MDEDLKAITKGKSPKNWRWRLNHLYLFQGAKMKKVKKISFILISLLLLLNLAGGKNEKRIEKNDKKIDCKQFHEGTIQVEINGFLIKVVRSKNIQIEYRTDEYYTKERIEWIDECSYTKTYIEVNDPIVPAREKERWLKTKFRMRISKIIDATTFEVLDTTGFWRDVLYVYKKIE